MRGAAVVLALTALGGSHGERYVRVPSSAMEPTIHCARPAPGCLGAREDRLVVRPYGRTRPRRGDIVVFEKPLFVLDRCGDGGKFVKRVVGLPRERWEERRGVIWIDGRPLREPYAIHRGRESLGGQRIPPGRYFLRGDNRASECDALVWGLVPLRSIVGKVVEVRRGSRRIRIG